MPDSVKTPPRAPVPQNKEEAVGRMVAVFDAFLPEGAKQYRKLAGTLAGGAMAVGLAFGLPLPPMAEHAIQWGIMGALTLLLPNSLPPASANKKGS